MKVLKDTKRKRIDGWKRKLESWRVGAGAGTGVRLQLGLKTEEEASESDREPPLKSRCIKVFEDVEVPRSLSPAFYKFLLSTFYTQSLFSCFSFSFFSVESRIQNLVSSIFFSSFLIQSVVSSFSDFFSNFLQVSSFQLPTQ